MRWIRPALVFALAGLGCDGQVAGAGEAHPPSASARHSAPRVRAPLNAPDVTRALAAVDPKDLCVTKGAIDTATIDVPTFRAVAPGHQGNAAAIKLTVVGDTHQRRALASGQERRQVGLKLRAENGCNLVYVMWRLDPKPKLEVSLKRNSGQRTAKECGANGYQKVKPSFTKLAATLDDGAPHELRAEIVGDTLTAWVDGSVAWTGTLPASARDLIGPAGVRSDNLAFDLAAFSVDAEATTAKAEAKCVDDETDAHEP